MTVLTSPLTFFFFDFLTIPTAIKHTSEFYDTCVAVTRRQRTLFLSLFDYFFRLCNVITPSVSVPESSNLIFNNSYLSTKSVPNSGLKLQSILVGYLI